MLVGTILEEGLKTFNFLSLLWKETIEMFSIRQGNKSKHKFVGTKVCYFKTLECKKIFHKS